MHKQNSTDVDSQGGASLTTLFTVCPLKPVVNFISLFYVFSF